MLLTRGRSVRLGGHLYRDSIEAAPSGAASAFPAHPERPRGPGGVLLAEIPSPSPPRPVGYAPLVSSPSLPQTLSLRALNRAVVQAINVGRSIAPDVRAVLISDKPEEAAVLRDRWEHQLADVPLVIVESPYRALVGPLLAYLDVLETAWPPDKPAPITFIVIPEYVARSWWERLLYNQSAKRLRAALIGRPHTVVVSVPYRREEAEPVI